MIARPALSPRQTRTALDLLTAGMVISVAFALAGLTWRIAGHAGTGAITIPSGRSAPGTPVDVSPAIALAPFGKGGTGTDASTPTALPLVLQGVVASSSPGASTAFILVSGQPAAPFQIGQNVGGATIAAILRDRVILNNGGRAEYLTFPQPDASATPGATGTTAAIQPGGRALGAPPAAAPAAPPQNAGPPPATAALLQRFNATPAGGGYRIGTSAMPGLNAGDILMSVNGTALSDPTAAGAAFSAAQASGSATIQVIRDGKRLTLTVPLR